MVGPTCWAWKIQDCDGGLWQQGRPSPFTFLIDVQAIKHEAYWSQLKYLNIIILCDGCVSHWMWILSRLILCWWNKSDTWYMIPVEYCIPIDFAYQLVCRFFQIDTRIHIGNWHYHSSMVESGLWCEHEILFIPFWHLKFLDPAILVPDPKPIYVFTRGINIA
jgi:hypothetical protein